MMANSNSLRNVLCFALLVATLPATFASASAYPSICYKRTQKCCFNYRSCGAVIKKVPKTVDCSFKKCSTVCKPHCVQVPKKVAYQSCKNVKVEHGQVCKNVKVLHNHVYVWKKQCKPKFVEKRVCKTLYRVVKKKVCNKKCGKVCKTVSATCVKIRVLSFPKFCPKLSCGKFVTTGPSKNPGVKVSKKSKLVKVIDGKRTIKH